MTDSVQTKHAQDAQKVNSYSKQQQLTQQKGTGEKATAVADDVHTKHATGTLKVLFFLASVANSSRLVFGLIDSVIAPPNDDMDWRFD